MKPDTPSTWTPERLQQEILERRKNPAMMEEYEAKVRVRRALRMAGEDDMADAVEVFSDKENAVNGS